MNLRRLARRYAIKHGLDPDLFEKQIDAESGFKVTIGSPAGARDIAQFMPGTAAAEGVTLGDKRPHDDLNAAARLMARYVKKYGSYEKALRAYNAGPGAIEKSRGYAETNEYVRKILGDGPGQTKLNKRRAGGAAGPSPSMGTKKISLGSSADPAAAVELTLDFLNDKADVLDLAAGLQSLMSAPDETIEVPVLKDSQRNSKRREAALPAKGGKLQIEEMYFDPGLNLDSGQKVGAIGGHGSHVHVASSKGDDMVKIVRLAKRLGLSVRELHGHEQVDPVHTDGSFHYQKTKTSRGRTIGKAADISGDMKKLKRFNRIIARRAK